MRTVQTGPGDRAGRPVRAAGRLAAHGRSGPARLAGRGCCAAWSWTRCCSAVSSRSGSDGARPGQPGDPDPSHARRRGRPPWSSTRLVRPVPVARARGPRGRRPRPRRRGRLGRAADRNRRRRWAARFDMEIDAFLIFVLSVYVARVRRSLGPRHRRGALRAPGRRLGAALAARGRSRRATGGSRSPRSRASCSRSPWRRFLPAPVTARPARAGPDPAGRVVRPRRLWLWRRDRLARRGRVVVRRATAGVRSLARELNGLGAAVADDPGDGRAGPAAGLVRADLPGPARRLTRRRLPRLPSRVCCSSLLGLLLPCGRRDG